jgi:uncharacterized protein involved in exopolysaccharide biosynthesis
MSNPNRVPDESMPVRTPGLADALRRLANSPGSASPLPPPRRRSTGSRTVEEFEFRAREIFAIFRRQKRLFAAVFLSVALVLGLAIALQTPQFESTALLLVKVGRELIYTPEVGDQPSVSSRDKTTVINSELAIMRAEPVIAGVVKSVGLANLYPDLGEELAESQGDPEAEQIANVLAAKAAERLREALVVLALPEADVLQVSFRHPDATIAQNTVNSLIDRFTEAHLGAFSEPEVVRFLDEQVSSYRASLEKAEGELREFELAHPVFAEEVPQAALTKRLEEQRAQIDAIDAQLTQVRMSSVGDRSSLADAQRERLALELEASKVIGHLRDNTNRRIAVVRQFIAARQGEIQTQVDTLQNRRAELQKDLERSEKEREEMPALSTQHRDLLRERAAHEDQYNTYLKRLRDARLSHQMDTEKIASISVVQKASVAPEAVAPLPPMLGIPLVLVLALLLAGLTATLADHYRWTWANDLDKDRVKAELHKLHRMADQALRR